MAYQVVVHLEYKNATCLTCPCPHKEKEREEKFNPQVKYLQDPHSKDYQIPVQQCCVVEGTLL